MNVLGVTYADRLSGAGIAALRVQRAVQSSGIRARLGVMEKRLPGEESVPLGGVAAHLCVRVRQILARRLLDAAGVPRERVASINLFPSGLHRAINAQRADVVHLHWIGAEMLGIDEVPRIHAALVWTLHDEWFHLGLEHYAARESGALYARLDRRMQKLKRRAWAQALPVLVAPSRWLAQEVGRSGMAGDAELFTIPNPIPVDRFRPMDRREARQRLGLAPEGHVVGFGAIGGTGDPRKGGDLLREALKLISSRRRDVTLLVFGASSGEPSALPARYAGVVEDEAMLALHYAAMDVFVCASRQENLPNTIAEAMACARPCVAFRTGGIPDLVAHGRSGYLAEPFSAADLARGIEECLEGERNARYGAAGRAIAESRLAPAVVAPAYAHVYRVALERRARKRGAGISSADG